MKKLHHSLSLMLCLCMLCTSVFGDFSIAFAAENSDPTLDIIEAAPEPQADTHAPESASPEIPQALPAEEPVLELGGEDDGSANAAGANGTTDTGEHPAQDALYRLPASQSPAFTFGYGVLLEDAKLYEEYNALTHVRATLPKNAVVLADDRKNEAGVDRLHIWLSYERLALHCWINASSVRPMSEEEVQLFQSGLDQPICYRDDVNYPLDAPALALEPPRTEAETPTEPIENEDAEPGAPSKPSDSAGAEPGAPTKPIKSADTESGAPSKPSDSAGAEPGAPTKPIESADTESGAPSKPSDSAGAEPGAPPIPNSKAAEAVALALPSEAVTLSIGDTYAIGGTFTDGVARALAYHVDVSGIVSVRADGELTALAAGEATIAVRCAELGVTKKLRVTVLPDHAMADTDADATPLTDADAPLPTNADASSDTDADATPLTNTDTSLPTNVDETSDTDASLPTDTDATLPTDAPLSGSSPADAPMLRAAALQDSGNSSVIPEVADLDVGDTLSLALSGEAAFATSDSSIAAVDANGVVTAMARGEAVISITAPNIAATCRVTVYGHPESIALSKRDVALAVGDAETLSATLPAYTRGTVVYTTDDARVAIADAQGRITATGRGACTITASVGDSARAACAVAVYAPADSISAALTRSELYTGETAQLLAEIPAHTRSAITYASSDTAVATVDADGRVTAISRGDCFITAAANGNQVRCALKVYAAPTDFTATLDRAALFVGETTALRVALPYLTRGTVTYATSDASVAVIGDTGAVTAVGKGACQLSATVAGCGTKSFPIEVWEKATALTLSIDQSRVAVGGSAQALVAFAESAKNTYSLESSDPKVAAVDANGAVTALSAGICTITAKIDGQTVASLDFEAYTPDVVLNRSQLVLGVGQKYKLTAKVNSAALSLAGARYASSDAAVAAVDADTGAVLAGAVGTARITLTLNTGETASCDIQVYARPTAVAITGAAKVIGIGQTADPITYRLMSGAEEIQGGVSFTSSNTAVASVNAAGQVYGKKAGTAKITVKTYNGKSASFKVTVKKKPTKLTISAPGALAVGQTGKIACTVPSGTATSYTFASSDPGIAAVSSSGVITALAPGNTTLTVRTHNGLAKTATLAVSAAPTELQLSLSAARLGVGMTATSSAALNATSSVGFGLQFWTNRPEIVQVHATSGAVKALAPGFAEIYVSAYNGLDAHFDPALNTYVQTVQTVEVVPGPTSLGVSAPMVGVGEIARLNVSMKDAGDDCLTDYRYSTSNKRIVQVNSAGQIKGVKAGAATITVVAANGRKATCKVKVVKAPTKVALSKTSLTLGVDQRYTLKAAVPSGAASQFTYASNNPGVATVDAATGEVTALACGNATITVRTFNKKTASCKVQVFNAPTAFALNVPEATLGEGGHTQQLSAVYQPGEMGEIRQYLSSDTSVAEVSAAGLVTAKRMGTAMVTAIAHNGTYASCRITVTHAPDAVVSDANTYNVIVGKSFKLPVLFTYQGTDDCASMERFVSTNKKIASVSSAGVVKGVKAGTAYIDVYAHNNVRKRIKIVVRRTPTKVALNATRLTLGVGETARIQGKIYYSGGNLLYSAGDSVSFAAFSSLTPGFASVDQNGMITALAEGTAKIRLKTMNGKQADCTVTIRSAPESVTLLPAALTLGIGQAGAVSHSLPDGSAGTVTYASSNEAIAKVDAKSGKVTPVAVGQADITATAYNGASTSMAVTVKSAPASVQLEPKKLYIGVGEIYTLSPIIPEDSAAAFTYSTSSKRYVAVNASGMIKGVKAGSAKITVKTQNKKTASVQVTVRKAPTSIALAAKQLSLGLGETYTLPYTLSKNAASAGVQATSADTAIVQVGEDNLLTAVGLGETTVTYKTYNGKTASCVVTVLNAPTRIELLPENPVLGVGQSIQLAAGLDEGSFAHIRFSGSNSAVLTVSEAGLLTAKGIGTATVSASTYIDGVSAATEVSVLPAPASVALAETRIELDISQQTTYALVPILPEGTAAGFTYATSNKAVFTIDANGLITAVGRGEAKATVKTHNNRSASVTVYVFDPYYPDSCTLVSKPAYMEIGDTFTPELLVLPACADPAIVWSSSDPQIAQVDSATGVVTAVSYGYVTITGKSSKNSAIKLVYAFVVLSDERTLIMPARITGIDGIQANLNRIDNVLDSAYKELEALYARGTIGKAEYNKRKSILKNVFSLYSFPWMTKTKQPYWKRANSEGGAKDFKPGNVYYGLPYIMSPSANRRYAPSKAVNEGRYTNSGAGYYLLNRSKLLNGTYCGNDCSSFVSMATWGMSSSHTYDTTLKIAGDSAYVTVSKNNLRPGDLINKSGVHVVMFLYYADAAQTQMVVIEQGGSEFGINTCSASIRSTGYYFNAGYKVRRLRKF